MHTYGVYFNPKENDENLEDAHTAECLRKSRREVPPYRKKRKSLGLF